MPPWFLHVVPTCSEVNIHRQIVTKCTGSCGRHYDFPLLDQCRTAPCSNQLINRPSRRAPRWLGVHFLPCHWHSLCAIHASGTFPPPPSCRVPAHLSPFAPIGCQFVSLYSTSVMSHSHVHAKCCHHDHGDEAATENTSLLYRIGGTIHSMLTHSHSHGSRSVPLPVADALFFLTHVQLQRLR